LPLSHNYIETLSTHFARAYLQISDAVAVMAGAYGGESLPALHALPLALPRLLRPAGVLWNRDRPLSPSAQRVIHCLTQTAALIQHRATAMPLCTHQADT